MKTTTLRAVEIDNVPNGEIEIVFIWENLRFTSTNIHQGTPDQVSDALMRLARQIQDDKMAGKFDER